MVDRRALCSLCPTFLSTKQRFTEKSRVKGNVIATNMFCADSHLNTTLVLVDMTGSVPTRNDTTRVQQAAPLWTLMGARALGIDDGPSDMVNRENAAPSTAVNV